MKMQMPSRGMTLVEMLVVISIIAILIAIALPAIAGSRESARDTTCKSNLHEFGVGLANHADRNRTYCSGAFDWRRDGAVTEIGWVADLVKQGTLVGQMLCPSSQTRLSETYQDLLFGTFTSADQQCNPLLAGANPNSTDPGPCKELLNLPPGSEQRRSLVEQKIWAKSFNTNYVASWLLVRSAIRLGPDGNLSATPGCNADTNCRSCTFGPCSQTRVDSLMITTLVPLLSCAAGTGQILDQTVGDVSAGVELAESFSDGPVERTTMLPPTITPGTPELGPNGWRQRWARTLHDYRDFGPVHGRGSGSCNVLFADGGVRSFVDQNSDQLLNNGFPSGAATGFADTTVELPESKIYSGN